MKHDLTTYRSLHDYLDRHLGINPSNDDIARAKKEYWSWYRTEHRKKRRAQAKVIQLTLAIELWKALISEAKESNMDVYDYIKQKLESKGTVVRLDLSFKKALYECIDMLNEQTHAHIIERLESIIERI